MTQEDSPPVTSHDLPDIDTLWNHSDPTGTETKFKALLETEHARTNQAFRAEVLTQVARTQGLQQRFDEALATLTQARSLITTNMATAHVRALLEHGRVINSSGKPDDSISYFEQALEAANKAGQEAHAVDAAHMLGIVCKGPKAQAWNERALKMANASQDPGARRWRAALCNNLGWTYHAQGEHQRALEMFEQHLSIRTEANHRFQMGIARWSIAKMQRFLGAPELALETQRELLTWPERQNNAAEGYTQEEVAECLLAQERADEAKPHFARAWELLHTDIWLKRDEPERLERLKRLGSVT
mgnify:CR=1 FL=1